MEIYEAKIKDVWFKASVLGSIWASFEIVIGSFLHNIKFPMSGTLLTILAIVIVITFSQKWKDKGIVVRAGIIAALMKSISPSAVLIGPMTGIFMEALLIEFAFIIFGKNTIGYLFAGIFAVYSVLIHKVLTLLVLYGNNIVKISENLYYFIAKQLEISNISFLKGLLLLSLFYVIIGLIASILGIYIGNNANKNSTPEELDFSGFKKDFLTENKKDKFSAKFVLIHIVFMIVVFISISKFKFHISLIISIIYIAFCLIRYKKSFRHFKKISFWLQILFLLVISILFYSGVQNISLFNKEGLLAGLLMVERMFVLFMGFAAISFEMRNPLVQAILYRKGLGNLYQSMGLAFSVLPEIIKRNTNPKILFKSPIQVFTGMVNIADSVYQNFMTKIKNREIIVITGGKNIGKTTFVEQLIAELKQNNVKIAGFTAQGIFENNKKTGFNLKDISSGEMRELCTIKKSTSIITGRFFFNENTIKWGESLIIDALNKDETDYFIFDEIGSLELKNKGWSDIIEKTFSNKKTTQIWVVRNSLVKEILRKFAISKAKIFDIKSSSIDEIIKLLPDKHNT